MRFGMVTGLVGLVLLAGCEGEQGSDGSPGVPCTDACVTSESIADGAVLSNHLGAGAVTGAALADGSVTAAKLATDSVGATALQDGSVGTSAMATQSIVAALLADLAVTTGKIADGAVDAFKLAANAVDTLHLVDGAVATAKLEDLAVTTSKIQDGAVGSLQLANGGVGGIDLDPAIAGNGLTLSSSVLSANTNVLQARVGTCNPGFALRSVDAAGNPTCEEIKDPRFITGLIPTGSGNPADGLPDCVIGEVRMFPYNFAPKGTFVADGRTLLISEHTALFALLGTNYGGNGVANFKIPDLREHAPQGVGYVICVTGIFPQIN